MILTGGKQYKVSTGDVIYIEKLDVKEGEEISFDNVLLSSDIIGTPFVEGATVEAKVLKNGKAKKITIFKFRTAKGYRRKQGHRQPYTKVEITKA